MSTAGSTEGEGALPRPFGFPTAPERCSLLAITSCSAPRPALSTLARSAPRREQGAGRTSSPEQLAASVQSLQQIDPLAEEAAAAREAAEEAASKAERKCEGRGAVMDAADAEQLGLRADAIALSPDGIAAIYSAE